MVRSTSAAESIDALFNELLATTPSRTCCAVAMLLSYPRFDASALRCTEDHLSARFLHMQPRFVNALNRDTEGLKHNRKRQGPLQIVSRFVWSNQRLRECSHSTRFRDDTILNFVSVSDEEDSLLGPGPVLLKRIA